MTATPNLLAILCVALSLSLCGSPAWGRHDAAVALSLSSRLIFGQSNALSAREQAGELLKRARAAIREGDFDLAKFYVERAEKLDVDYNGFLHRFGDSPQKVRREMARAQGESVQAPSRQFPLPEPRAPAGPPSPADGSYPYADAQLTLMTSQAILDARRQLEKGRAALAQGDLTSAIGWYHSALATGAPFSGEQYKPEDLAAELRSAGVDASRLVPASVQGNASDSVSPQEIRGLGRQIPPILEQATEAFPQSQMIANPYTNHSLDRLTGQPLRQAAQSAGPSAPSRPPQGETAASDGRLAQALQLMAMARVALDRGELDRAQQLAQDADRLKVPESQFGAEDTRPWMLLMEIGRQRRERDSHVAQASSGDIVSGQEREREADFGSAGQPIDATGPPPFPSNLDPLELPQELSAVIEPGENQLVPAPAASLEENGMELFHRGEESLRNDDLETARELFQRAWSLRGELDPQTHQRLQDHLQRLRGSRAAAPPAPATAAEQHDQSDRDSAQQQLVRVLFNQITREQADINRQRERDPKGAWERLKQLRSRVADSEVDVASRQQLLTRIDRSIEDMERYLEQNRARIELDERNRQVLDDVERYRQQKLQVQQKLAEFVEEFNVLMQQQRFPEAVVVAKKAHQLAPLDPVVQNMMWKSQFARQFASGTARQERTQAAALASFDSIGQSAVPFDDRIAIEFPEPRFWSDLTESRRRLLEENMRRYSEAELQIQKALDEKVEVNFQNTPLSQVVDTLRQMAGINIVLDPEGIRAEAVTSDTPVTLPLHKPVSLRSALNLILQPIRLGYVIQDEVLRITSEQERSGDVYERVYNVADLVIPIPNFVPSYNMGLAGAINEAMRSQGAGLLAGRVHEAPLAVVAGSEGVGESAAGQILAQTGTSGPWASPTSAATWTGPGGVGGGPQADFDSLIELITTTIEPDSWEEVGGEGTIAPFETNLSLVVSQTQEVHERIVDLLRQLRRLQDLQVTIEVRFITLADNFFERIGVDFDFNIDDNTGLSLQDVQTADDSGPSITVGLDPNGNFTTDLDLQFTQDSFGATQPIFGGFEPGSAANFGFAILSDIEAFFVIQAAQGDNRTNVLQAPKVTLFNGQLAFVTDSSMRPFVTSVIPVVGDFAAAHQPVVTVLSEGTSLSVQAVVSPDRRFVRLTLVPMFSRIGQVDTFTFSGKTTSNSGTAAVDPSDDTSSVQNDAENITEGTTVQLPTFAMTSVTTTVSVPDGGTILLGGIKRLSEGRTERGLPLMSRLPYVNRLFKNVGIGRETESLMMMVTPRIIIQEEEEEQLLGGSIPTP